ncbi:MAG: M48 family metallopeptidase [Deltaproteobacteria bacterium]
MSAPLPARRTLDFFDAQSRARRNTGLLVFLFVFAWLATIALADVGLSVALSVDPVTLLLPVAGLVTLVVLSGSAFHAVRLASGGGDAVARMLGGRAVDRQTTDPAERRLVNVVEEMAIASGLPVPRLYVLDAESGMNAFAAGFTPERSVVAVTRGTLEGLDRDELHGVVAHELSHVLNADTRLSTRLMAMVGGLTVLALLGRILLRGDGRGKDRGVAVGAGLALLVAGSIGAFFGRLIRLAVSRQREFLADAAAVQFTRNPGGLARALGKIAQQGSRLSTPEALEASHLFFAEGVGGFLSSFLSTHPPLEERIRRITQGEPGTGGAAPPPRPVAPVGPGRDGVVLPPAIVAAAATVGRPGPEHIERAGEILSALPAGLVGLAREPLGAREVACALLLDPAPEARERQFLALERDPAVASGVRPVAARIEPLDPAARLALLDLALPALDHLSPAQADELLRDLAAVAARQARPEPFRWAVRRVIERRVAPLLGGRRNAPIRIWALEDVQVECLELLSALAWSGAAGPADAQRALEAGLAALGVPVSWRLLPAEKVDPARLDLVLAHLDEAAPQLKARILAACAACALADRTVVPGEGGIVRAVAASLGCPVPPLAAPS